MKPAVDLLISSQNSDGGWGATPERKSNTETSSLALLALASLNDAAVGASIRRGFEWLIKRQHSDGSWSLNDSTLEPSWCTALAMLPLGLRPEYQERVLRAAKWVLGQQGSKPGWLANLVLALSFQKKAVDLNEDLIGWPWVAGSFSWVEPTSYCLLALKQLKPNLGGTNVDERIRQGELMIYDRMCEGGGWNYGNSIVYGEKLWPYPEVTAVVLLALQDRRDATQIQASLRALENMLENVDSGLALSWALICFCLYRRDLRRWKKALQERFEKTRFLGETKVIALSLLALGDGAKYFRI